jgi:ABC-type Mn2+/Zn2+ transport system permease subunit
MDFLTDPWDFEFMRRALLAGVIVSVAASVVGTFVVLKGLAFLGDAVAHTQLAGAAIVLVAGGGTVLITLGAAAAAVVTALGVAALTRSGQVRQDTAIGILFAGFFALGVLLISRQRNFALDLNSFLVGNILGVVNDDVIVMGVLAAAVILLTAFFYTELRFVAYDPEMAAASGVPVGLVQTGLLLLVALAAVVAFRLVGVVLALAMLVAPAAAASLMTRNIPRIMLGSVGFGVAATVVGLYASFHADVAAGPAIVLSAVGIFVLAFLVSPRGLRSGWRLGRRGAAR